MTGEPPNEKQLQSYGKQLAGVLQQIDQIWLKENPFIAGNDLTIADLLAVTELEQPGNKRQLR
jgi:glutathione S-transferase